jgi:hypothetical protein
MSTRSATHAAHSCESCLGWGILFARKRCRACYTHDRANSEGICTTCARTASLRRGHCRLCWENARTLAHATGNRGVTEVHCTAEVRHPQLYFTGLIPPRRTGSTSSRSKTRVRVATPRSEPARGNAVSSADGQYSLFLIGEHGATVAADGYQVTAGYRALAAALWLVEQTSENHGWGSAVTINCRRALTIMLAGFVEGDRFAHSRLHASLRAPAVLLSVERTAEILDALGLYTDDRPSRVDTALDRALTGVAEGIAGEVERWVRSLIAGDARRSPRQKQTVLRYLHSLRPALTAWSQRYVHLREVTREDVLDSLAPLSGNTRQATLVALRSLFRTAKKSGAIFRDPTSRIRVGAASGAILQPLPDEHVRQTVAAAGRPADPLILALATIHAARGHTIRAVLLTDIDLGNRRIVLAGRVHPLDELTHRALRSWLDYRRRTWPITPNPHLLINVRTAAATTRVGHAWLSKVFRGLPATLERLRMDRHLDEAIAYRADPRHLVAVFDIDEKTALRYANSARQLLATTIETYDRRDSASPPS